LSDFVDDLTEDGRSIVAATTKERLDFNQASQPTHISFCQAYLNFFLLLLISCISFVTPVLFVILPRFELYPGWHVTDCGLECEGLLIGIAFKLFVVMSGVWMVILRKVRYFMPRMFDVSALLMMFIVIINFSFWLFYVVRIVFEQIEVS